MTPYPIHAAPTTAFRSARVRTWPVSVTLLSLVLTTTSLSSGTSAERSSACLTSSLTSAGSTAKATSISSLTLRTPVSSRTAYSASVRWLPYFTMPVSVRLPFLAVASIPSGTVTLPASASFAAVVSVASS